MRADTRPYRGNLGKTHTVPAFILRAETIKVFGVDPARLKPSSCRKVIATCSICFDLREISYRRALRQRKCLNCSNGINARLESGRRSRSNRLKTFYANGGKHPLSGIGHSIESRKKMSESRKGLKINLSEESRKKLADHCMRVLNNPEQKKRTALKILRGKDNPAYGKPPAHTKKIWYDRAPGTRVCFRSSWEFLFAGWLDKHYIPWHYEKETFPVRYEENGISIDGSYTPDFVTPLGYFEVKGRWTLRGRKKFDAFVEQYPEKKRTIIDRGSLKAMKLL